MDNRNTYMHNLKNTRLGVLKINFVQLLFIFNLISQGEQKKGYL